MIGAVAFAGMSLPASAQAADAKATVVHGIPGLTVDVYANGASLLEDFAPGDVAGPVMLPAGHYEFEITPAGSSDVVLSAAASIGNGDDVTAIAHLDENGAPTIGLFKNKMGPIWPAKARITVRHTAAAPAVDIRFKRPGGKWKIFAGDVTNGEHGTRSLRTRPYKFDVVVAGTTTRVLGPAKLTLSRRTHYFINAWGSAADETLSLNVSTRSLPRRSH
jgi:hypothetical protein